MSTMSARTNARRSALSNKKSPNHPQQQSDPTRKTTADPSVVDPHPSQTTPHTQTRTASYNTNRTTQSREDDKTTNERDEEQSMVMQLFQFLTGQPPTTTLAPTINKSKPLSSSTSTSTRIDSYILLSLLLLFALLLRYGVSGGGHSGMGRPQDLYGDYEAQRHWMEITVNLPISEWYHNTTQNNLQYWGLDYPPLTAYVSYGFGRLAQLVGEGDLVTLWTSRGHETVSSKYFMRMTVMICDLLIFLPAMALALRVINPYASRARYFLLLHLVWIAPAFILIDHGHFQYNCFSLGLVAYAVWLHYQRRDLLGAIAFVLSMAFKQMSLYYAPAFFAYLLTRTRVGKGRNQVVPISTSLGRLIVLGGVVISTFVLCFLPFLTSWSQLSQVFHRMFPFARGLYEDKVSNFWCATSILIKWHLWFERSRMVQASLICTMIAFLPSCVHVYQYPSRKSFIYTLASCAFSFYLFSFQVHEKTILLPFLPVALLVGQHPLLFTWMSIIANFSMYPLLEKDGHILTYAILQLFFIFQAMSFARTELFSDKSQRSTTTPTSSFAARIVEIGRSHPMIMYRLVQLSIVGAGLLHVLWFTLPASSRYPDLLTMLFVIYSAAHFILFYIILNVQQWSLPLEEVEDEELQTATKRTKRQPH